MTEIKCPTCGNEIAGLRVQYYCAQDHQWGEVVDRPVESTDVPRSDEQRLAKEQAKRVADFQVTVHGRPLNIQEPDKKRMPFGKHKGKFLEDIPIDYFEWCLTNIDNLNPVLAEEMRNQLDLKKGKGVAR